jgi:hypothetical protein
MTERGLILPIGDNCYLMVAPYWRCLTGHKWVYSPDNKHLRHCSRCDKHMAYQLVDIGRGKTWCWVMPKELLTT